MPATAHVLTNAFGGISILTEGGRTPRPRHRGARHGPWGCPTQELATAFSTAHESQRSRLLVRQHLRKLQLSTANQGGDLGLIPPRTRALFTRPRGWTVTSTARDAGS